MVGVGHRKVLGTYTDTHFSRFLVVPNVSTVTGNRRPHIILHGIIKIIIVVEMANKTTTVHPRNMTIGVMLSFIAVAYLKFQGGQFLKNSMLYFTLYLPDY